MADQTIPSLNNINLASIVNIKTPQLIGIICGCVVFTITIGVVFYLLVSSGTLHRAFEEIRTGKPAENADKAKANNKIEEVEVIPELYDHLLLASEKLPLLPSIPALLTKRIDVRPLKTEDGPSIVAIGDGSAIFGESAYDPLRIWRWLADANSKAQSLNGKFPCESLEIFSKVFTYDKCEKNNFLHLVVIDIIVKKPIGMISVVDNCPSCLSVRLENIWITPAYQRTNRSHEAVLLVLQSLFSEGYRRVTVELDSRHMIGRKFVEQCGFVLEAILRKHRIVNKRNRDTALYVILNSDWPECEIALKKKIGIPLKDGKQ